MRSLEQIKTELVDDILELRSDIRIVAGDPQYDVVIASPANQFYRYEILLELEDRTRTLDEYQQLINDETFKEQVAEVLGFKQDGTAYTVDDINDLISARLDAYVSDWDITRNPGTAATGVVREYLTTADTVSWNDSTQFTSLSGITYNATSAISAIIPNFNSANGLYFVDIPVAASVTGSNTNAVASSITNVDPKPNSFSYCINENAVDGGTDQEGDLDLINRAEDVWAERVNGSKQAFERIADAETYVDDSLALDEDTEAEQVYIGSVCDVFTQFTSEDTELVEEIFYWPGESENASEEQFDFVPTNQPMLSTILPIIFKYTTLGVEEQVVPDGDLIVVSIVPDTNTFSGSAKANDKLRIKTPLNTNEYQRRLRVLYNYDKNPFKLQSVFDDSEEKMVGPSVLVRKAVEVPIRVIVEVQISFGYTDFEVQTVITSNISVYFTGGITSFGRQYARKKIDEEISHSDIANIILRTEGVVSYDRDTFFVVNTVTGNLSDPTVINSNQYASLLDVLYEFSNANLSNFTATSGGI